MNAYYICRVSGNTGYQMENYRNQGRRMYLNFKRFYRTRLILACIVLALALLYLGGGEKVALMGFAILTLFTVLGCDKLRKGVMPAVCDLCGSQGAMKAEYGAGFSNARLVLNCSHCGRVVNVADEGVELQVEKEEG